MPQFTEMRRPALWEGYRSGARAVRIDRRARVSRSPRTVVLGYDGSAAARNAALRAAEAAGAGGRILAITAIPSPDASELERELTHIADPQGLLQEVETLLQAHHVEVATRVEEEIRSTHSSLPPFASRPVCWSSAHAAVITSLAFFAARWPSVS